MSIDTTQSELDQFLESQFSDNNEAPPPEEKDDEVINEYLGGDDADTATGSQVDSTLSTTTPAPSVQPVNDADRLIQLERELAAAKERERLYANMVQQQYNPPQDSVPPQEFRPFDETELTIDEQLVKDYGHAEPYITAVARRVAEDLHRRAVQPLYQQLEMTQAQLARQQQFNQRQHQDVIYAQLKQVVPDIDTLATSQEWQSWIKQPDDYGGTRTIAHYVQEGIQSGNVNQIAAIVSKFKQAQAQSKPQQSQVSPGIAPQTQPNTRVNRGRVLKMSDFDRATADFQAGRLSYDRYLKISDAFNAAHLEGRVDVNK